MSVILLGPEHISYLVDSVGLEGIEWMDGSLRNICNLEDKQVVVALLAESNAKAYNELYGHLDDHTPADGRMDYTCQITPRGFDPVQGLKALRCYEYNAETEDENGNPNFAGRFCRRLKDQLISELPGYDEAKWEL